jgi:hypothetical protein
MSKFHAILIAVCSVLLVGCSGRFESTETAMNNTGTMLGTDVVEKAESDLDQEVDSSNFDKCSSHTRGLELPAWPECAGSKARLRLRILPCGGAVYSRFQGTLFPSWEGAPSDPLLIELDPEPDGTFVWDSECLTGISSFTFIPRIRKSELSSVQAALELSCDCSGD